MEELVELAEIPLFVEWAAFFQHVPHLCGQRLADDVADLVAGYSALGQLFCNGGYARRLVVGYLPFDDRVEREMGAGIPGVPLFIDQFFWK